jgi:hypothetical protein
VVAAAGGPAGRCAGAGELATVTAAAGPAAATLLPTPPPPPRAGRIVTAQFTELRARAHLAATFVVNDSLVATPTSRLQTWQTRSEPR